MLFACNAVFFHSFYLKMLYNTSVKNHCFITRDNNYYVGTNARIAKQRS